MSNYFQNNYFPDLDWNIIGRVAAPAANPIIQSLYPMEMMTKFHASQHISGLTGRWMDVVPGRLIPGGWSHRMLHGHHAIWDGMTVLRNPKLNYGEFLHHLGLDFLTSHGIPNPSLPTGTIFKALRGLWISEKWARELLTVNMSKLLGGSFSILCTGPDDWACFSDTIPHTWTAASWHFGLGVWDSIWGCFPPNPLLLASGGAEAGVGLVTGVRTLVDCFPRPWEGSPWGPWGGDPLGPLQNPLKPWKDLIEFFSPTTQPIVNTATVGFPIFSETVLLSALVGACVGYWSGQSYERIAKGAGISAVSSATAATISGALTGHFIAPFIGGIAGFATGLLLRKILLSTGKNSEAEEIKKVVTDYFAPSEYFKNPYFNNDAVVVPIMQLPDEPIGRLKDGELLLDSKAIRQKFEG